jgi:7-cyano-7-deazaguanine synthase
MQAAILLSGGIDSTAIAFWKKPQLAITIDYGQAPADAEINAAEIVAHTLNISHQIVRIGLRDLGSGVMAGMPQIEGAPSPEWWPFRNQLLVTIGAMAAIRRGCDELLIGTVASDDVHADGTSDFVKFLDSLLRYQEGALRLMAPAIQISSAELVEISGISDSLLAWCHSCHTGNVACGFCRGCLKSYSTRQTRSALRDG